MNISKEQLLHEATESGYRPDILEKVARLLGLLEGFVAHPFLRSRFALKGGTALNLFVFNIPRLSVDIDINYVGPAQRDQMLIERPKIEQAVAAVCQREGFVLRKVPAEHAGGKWQLRYESVLGTGGNLEIDVNFMFRVPLWPPISLNSRVIGNWSATGVPVVDLHELAAGKLAALFARQASRDLFDVHRLLARGGFDRQRLRIAFVVYGGINRKDWRTVKIDDVNVSDEEIRDRLLPVLSAAEAEEWASANSRHVQECRELLSIVVPLEPSEREFLDKLLDHGEIEPTLLTHDPALVGRIGVHPGLLWKAANVHSFKGHR